MDEQRTLEMIRRVRCISAAREPVEAIFAALKAFEKEARPYNRHLATPSPTEEEWRDIYARLEAHAGKLARALAANRDSFSRNLATGLDGTAGLIDEATAYNVDAPAVMKQFGVQEAVGTVERIPGKLSVFLYSWGRPSLAKFRGVQMQHAIEQATYIEREASYFAGYLNRLLDRGIVNDSRE